MIISTKGIVISKIKFKDNDLIVKCYTSSSGILSFLVKGALNSKKGKFKPAYFQPLTMLKMEIDFKENRGLHYIKGVRISNNYVSLHTVIFKSTVAIFLSEVLAMVLKEEEANNDLFTFIETALLMFDSIDSAPYFHHQFLMALTRYIGFSPDSSNSEYPFFNLQSGRYEISDSGRYSISGDKLRLFKTTLGMEFDKEKGELLTSSQKQELLEMILLYFKLHLQGFKSPKSLSILNQVFN